MLKDVLSNGALTHFATIGLVIFVVVFIGITVWVVTRSRKEIQTWSHIPLTGDEDGPLQPRGRDTDPGRPSSPTGSPSGPHPGARRNRA
jgi:cbb3-type cytochrome oxidase subunit 3